MHSSVVCKASKADDRTVRGQTTRSLDRLGSIQKQDEAHDSSGKEYTSDGLGENLALAMWLIRLGLSNSEAAVRGAVSAWKGGGKGMKAERGEAGEVGEGRGGVRCVLQCGLVESHACIVHIPEYRERCYICAARGIY